MIGKITPLKEGKVTITVTWKDKNLSDKVEINAIPISKDTKIEILDYKTNENILSNIAPNTITSDFLKHIIVSDNLEVNIKALDENQKFIGTNTKVTITEKNHNLILEEYDCLVYGDVNGDGNINSGDLLAIKKHLLGSATITDNLKNLSADTNKDKIINSGDLLSLKKHLLDIKYIEQ